MFSTTILQDALRVNIYMSHPLKNNFFGAHVNHKNPDQPEKPHTPIRLFELYRYILHYSIILSKQLRFDQIGQMCRLIWVFNVDAFLCHGTYSNNRGHGKYVHPCELSLLYLLTWHMKTKIKWPGANAGRSQSFLLAYANSPYLA